MLAHHVIYIPGLGDENIKSQKFIVGLWKIYGVKPYVHQLHWADGTPLKPKLDLLFEKIEQLAKDGGKVSLVGVSAGASAALHSYVSKKNKINGVVYLCGKLANPNNVNPRYFVQNPAFRDSMELLDKSLSQLTDRDKQKMLSIHPIYDETVNVEDTKIPGVKSKTFLSFGHVASIALGISLGSFAIIRFLKKQAKL